MMPITFLENKIKKRPGSNYRGSYHCAVGFFNLIIVIASIVTARSLEIVFANFPYPLRLIINKCCY